MLKDIANLLNNANPLPEKKSYRDDKVEKKVLSKEQIDELLLHAWENSLNETKMAAENSDLAYYAAQAIGYTKGIATALRNKAYLKMLESDYKHSLEEAQISLPLIDDKEYQLAGTVWDIIALSYNGLGLYEKSVESTYKSLDYFEKAQYKRGISWAHHNLGMVFSNIGEMDRADSEYRKSLKQFEDIEHREGIIRLCSLISTNLIKVKEFDKALDFLKRAENMTPDNEYSYQSFHTYLYHGIVRRLMGQLDDSKYYFGKCKRIISKIDNLELHAQYEYETALLLKDSGDLKSAIIHLDTALELSTKQDSKLIKKDTAHALSIVHEDLGHSVDALKYFKLYDRLSRELLSREDIQRIHNLEVQKDIEIAEQEKEYNRRLQEETEKILKNVLPVQIVEELKSTGSVKPKRISSATVLFTDFVGFTAMSSRTSPEEIVSQLDYCFSGFDRIMDDLGIEKLKTIGDGYMAVAGALTENENHTVLCVEAGLKIQKFMNDYIRMRKKEGKEYWDVRIGIHCGPLIAGVIGNKKFAYDVWGDTVNIASRIESGGQVGKVNISTQLYETVKNQFTCHFTGEVEAKGKGKISIYTVENKIS